MPSKHAQSLKRYRRRASRPNDRQRTKTRPQGTLEAVSSKPPAFSRRAWDAVIARVQRIGERDGRADYLERAEKVRSGREPASWAWPLAGADMAYINVVDTDCILEEIGAPAVRWDQISDDWCAAFKRGYEQAHAATQCTPQISPSPWRTDEPPRGVRCLVTAPSPSGVGYPKVYVASLTQDVERPQWHNDGHVITGVTAWMLAPEPAGISTKLQLEPGKFYRTESGSIWCCFKTTKLYGGRAWCVNHDSTHVQTFNLQGRGLFDSKLDLVAEVEVPQ